VTVAAHEDETTGPTEEWIVGRITIPGWCLRDPGNIAGLAASIENVGDQLQRLLAFASLERHDVPVRILDVEIESNAMQARLDAHSWERWNEDDEHLHDRRTVRARKLAAKAAAAEGAP
jgi:hypothetical protein